MSLVAELKQRKIVQWTIAYAAAAFALLQGVDIVAQRFGWPDTVSRVLIIGSCVGFLVTLLLAWYHGERGAQKVSGTELLLLSLLLAIGGAFAWKFAPAGPRTLPSGTAAATASATGDRRSIAVLPFVNMSGDKDNEYFSDGISEEILNVLARTPNLHVAARTSSFSFKGSKLEVPAIAQELKVRMVLEGSVRKQGDRVRITAQLIDAASGYHVWSQTFDRQLKDIFAIQDEIAMAIGKELEVELASPTASGKNSVGTSNLKAYDLYLRGIALWQTRNADSLWQAIAAFNQAIAADPKFAQAYGGLGLAYSVLPDNSTKIDYQEAYRRATDAAEMALVLDPLLAEPYVVLANSAGWERRGRTAIALNRRATVLRPSFATAYQWLGTELMVSGDPVAGLAALDHATDLDPRSLVVASNRSYVLTALGRNAQARAACERVLAFSPRYRGCRMRIALVELQRGDLPAARQALLQLAQLKGPAAEPLVHAVIGALQGRGDRAALARRLAAFPSRSNLDPDSGNVFGPDHTTVALILLGVPDLAMDYLERTVVEPGNIPATWTMMLPALDPIRCTPRFQALVEKLQAHDPRAATVCGLGAIAIGQSAKGEGAGQ